MELLTRIGPYTVTAQIGSGGMGEVYRAHDPRLDRDIALKVLNESLAGNAGLISRFQKEAKAIAALSHPNIVTIHDCGSDQGLFYIATELLDGETLREYIGSRPVPWRRAIKMALSIADGLRSAHAHGIAHRDLKPDNVFVTKDGLVKILDFGLAHTATGLAPESAILTLTTPGTLLGTPGYMSPEQVRGEPIDSRTDIFSFGCLMYEMLCGHRAFPGNSPAEFISALLRDDPEDLRVLVPELPEELIRVVEHCLEKKKELRFQHCSDLMFALTAASDATARTPPVTPVPPAARRKLQVLPIAALLVTLGITVYLGTRSHTTAPVTPAASVAVMPFAYTTTDPAVRAAADGLTQGVINNLSPATGVRVTPWNSVSYYRDKEKNPRVIRSDLAVDAMAVGQVMQQGPSYLVSVELIDTRDNHLIWGGRFEKRLLQEIERVISERIAAELKMPLSGSDALRISRRTSAKPEAYRQYQLGQYEKDKRTPDGLLKAIDHFNASIKVDPNYADAWVGIADSYMLLGGLYEVLDPRATMPKARDAARKALDLDPTLADAHASLGNISHEFDWDWPAAEREFKRAIELNPNCVTAHQWYGQALVYRGRSEDGLRELRRAEELDPRSLVSSNDIAQALWISGDYDGAIAKANSILDVEPQFWLSHWIKGLSYAEKKQFPLAIASLERAVSLGGTPAAIGSLGYVYGRAGRREDAMRILERLRKARNEHYLSPASFVLIYESLGEKDKAWQEVERAFEERTSLMTAMHRVPIAEGVRSDPRYPDFARRVGLPPLP